MNPFFPVNQNNDDDEERQPIECLEALIVCTGNGKIVQFYGSDNTVGEILRKICGFGMPPVAPYVVNGVGFEKGYYLANSIYPQWATFVKSFTVANDMKHAYFKKRQEDARKDVEHQKMAVFDWNDVYANLSRNMQRTWVKRCETQRRKNKEIRDREMHLSLQRNLMEHIWQEVEHGDEDF
ncbi:ALP1-like protein isoform X1 [Tanacetum coccineum]